MIHIIYLFTIWAAHAKAYHAAPLLRAADEIVETLDAHFGPANPLDVGELIHVVGRLTTEAVRAAPPLADEPLPTALRFLVAVERGTELKAQRMRAEGEVRAVLDALIERARPGEVEAARVIARLETPLATAALIHLARVTTSPAVRAVAAAALVARARARLGRDQVNLAVAEACAGALL